VEALKAHPQRPLLLDVARMVRIRPAVVFGDVIIGF
jgi:hypothetical protein